MCYGYDEVGADEQQERENRKVRAEDGSLRTFTQRGLDPQVGFIRVSGKTIQGFVSGGKFFAWERSKNRELVTA